MASFNVPHSQGIEKAVCNQVKYLKLLSIDLRDDIKRPTIYKDRKINIQRGTSDSSKKISVYDLVILENFLRVI